MKFLSFFSVIEEDLVEVERALERAGEVPEEGLSRALKGLLGTGGKRLRPGVALLSARLFPDGPGDSRKLVSLAASVELLHVATLIHDDFIDHSNLRRGTPTLNSLWEDSVVVLAGDYLFSRAAELAAATQDVRVLSGFAKTLRRISSGELRHIFGPFGSWPRDRAEYLRYIYAKTASLFATSAQCGGILAQAPQEGVRALRDYGYFLGMAFQMVDDLLDFVGTEEELGKPTGSDLHQGVLTLPALYYLQEHPERVLGNPAALDARGKERWANELAASIASSPAIECAQRDAKVFLAQAKERLAKLPTGPCREALAELADYVLERRI